MNMAGYRGVIDQNIVISDDAIVTNMNVGHEQVIGANAGFSVILYRAPMDRDTFSEDIIITNDEMGFLTPKFHVRGVFAKGSKLKNLIIFANNRWAF